MATSSLAIKVWECLLVGNSQAFCLSFCAVSLLGKQQTSMGISRVLCSLIAQSLKSKWEMRHLFSIPSSLALPCQRPAYILRSNVYAFGYLLSWTLHSFAPFLWMPRLGTRWHLVSQVWMPCIYRTWMVCIQLRNWGARNLIRKEASHILWGLKGSEMGMFPVSGPMRTLLRWPGSL